MHAKEWPSDRDHARRRNKQVKGEQIKIIAKENSQGKKKKDGIRRENMNIVGPLSVCLVIKVLKQKKGNQWIKRIKQPP